MKEFIFISLIFLKYMKQTKDFWILKSCVSCIKMPIQILLEVMEGILKTHQTHIID